MAVASLTPGGSLTRLPAGGSAGPKTGPGTGLTATVASCAALALGNVEGACAGPAALEDEAALHDAPVAST
eukprot:CAMPEP_0170602136 /NCGR_PEP_ID=MMETSP0224-20130122/18233_1 /TAXON_ID=285029 /ORGANISM="Togula jolla, Strain CCCM 725" /LENGTH=70 /DNA_ID=CAMNT_0010926961 /DNA_START=838 /DNA_END=1050 /DNA_ORIENTATION=-